MTQTSKLKKLALKEIASVFIDGDWIEKKDQSDKGILLIQTGNVGRGFYKDKVDRKFISEETFKRLKCKYVMPGDILISRLPDPVGKACIIPDLGIKMITAVDCTIFRPKENFDTRYLSYLLNSKIAQLQVENFIAGSSRKRISRKNLEKIELTVPFKNNRPDIREQKLIVTKIDKLFVEIDGADQGLKEGISDADKVLKSQLNDFFCVKLPNYFKIAPLGHLIKTTSGGTPKRNNRQYYGGNVPWIKSGELNDNRSISKSAELITEDAIQDSNAKILEPGTLLMAMYGATVGKLGMLSIKAATNQAVCAFLKNEYISNDYLFWFLLFYREHLIRDAFGGAQPNISQAIIKKIPVPLPYKDNHPDIIEQEKLVKRFDKLQNFVTAMKSQLKKQRYEFVLLKLSILNYAFTGKLVTVKRPEVKISKVSIFPIQQAMGAILQQFQRGEMVIAKMLYLAQQVYSVPLNIAFTPQSLGPYHPAIKKALFSGLTPKNLFFAKQNNDTFRLGQNASKLQYGIFGKMRPFLDEVLPDFTKNGVESSDIERLATVAMVVEKIQSTDTQKVKAGMLKIFPWKKGKFTDPQIEKSLAYIKTKSWDKKLVH